MDEQNSLQSEASEELSNQMIDRTLTDFLVSDSQLLKESSVQDDQLASSSRFLLGKDETNTRSFMTIGNKASIADFFLIHHIFVKFSFLVPCFMVIYFCSNK